MQRELVLMTKPKHKNVLMVHGMYALGSLGSLSAGPFRPLCTLWSARAVGVRSAETPAHLLLVMDLWDRSARSLLDDHNRVLKVQGWPGPPRLQAHRLHRACTPIFATVHRSPTCCTFSETWRRA